MPAALGADTRSDGGTCSIVVMLRAVTRPFGGQSLLKKSPASKMGRAEAGHPGASDIANPHNVHPRWRWKFIYSLVPGTFVIGNWRRRAKGVRLGRLLAAYFVSLIECLDQLVCKPFQLRGIFFHERVGGNLLPAALRFLETWR